MRGVTGEAEPDAAEERVCTQSACLLRTPGADRRFLAELLVSVIAGESVEELVPESRRIVPRDACVPCVLKVMDGGRAFVTDVEQQHLRDLGRWSHRRHRRQE